MEPRPGYTPPARPDRIVDRWVDAWNDHDADRIARLFDADAEFVNVTGLWWHDRNAIRTAHAYGFEAIFGTSTITVLDRRVKWIVGRPYASGAAVAVVHAKMRIDGQTPIDDVDAPGVRRTLFTFVVHRTEGRWRCVAAHNTDVVPGSETNVVGADGQMRSVSYRSGTSSGRT